MPQQRFPALLSLAAGAHQLPLIRAAQARGFKVLAVDRNPQALGMHEADVAIELSTHDAPAILEALEQLSSSFELKGILHRTSGQALHTAASLGETLKLPGLTPAAARVSTEKSALRELCAQHGIPMPRGKKCRADQTVPLGLPLIVKPDFPTVGKLNVRRVECETQLQPAMQAAANSSFNQMVEVEEYIDGIDVSCLFWLSGGDYKRIVSYDELIGVAEDGSLLPFGVALPSSLDVHACRSGIDDILAGLARALPGVQALLIVSMRVDQAGRPHVIELHADLGGDQIAEELFPRAMPELHFFDLAVRMAAGEALPELPLAQGSHMLLYDEAPLPSEVLSAPSLESNLDHLALRVLDSPRPVALPPRQITNWARALTGR